MNDTNDTRCHGGQPADESGQGLAEYALLLGLIAVAAVGALAMLGTAVDDLMGWRLFELVE